MVAISGLLVVAGVWVAEWAGVWHGHPLYGFLLLATALACAFGLYRSRRRVADQTGLRLVLRWVGMAALIGWLGLMAWLRPLTAEEPAVSAMASSDSVQVTEWPTEIMLRSSGDDQKVDRFFQPGAKVDARAYADEAQPGQVAGLLFYASYPAGDMSDFEHPVLSIPAEQYGLATPAKTETAASDLLVDTAYLEIEGAVHAFFGDYGDQSGDGTPQISHDAAREVITSETLAFMKGVSGNR
ncbi:alpha/beta hydrolase [Ornithinimicrobium sp. Arc0846-15]|nr:alpha/beta hydrolase [Ornithinimicrobium laminariae]